MAIRLAKERGDVPQLIIIGPLVLTSSVLSTGNEFDGEILSTAMRMGTWSGPASGLGLIVLKPVLEKDSTRLDSTWKENGASSSSRPRLLNKCESAYPYHPVNFIVHLQKAGVVLLRGICRSLLANPSTEIIQIWLLLRAARPKASRRAWRARRETAWRIRLWN